MSFLHINAVTFNGLIVAGEVPTELMECERRLPPAFVNRPVSPGRFEDALDVTRPPSRLPGRAVLIACSGTIGPSVPMSYRQLVIGSGFSPCIIFNSIKSFFYKLC